LPQTLSRCALTPDTYLSVSSLLASCSSLVTGALEEGGSGLGLGE
jgi:hypothetical protein